MAAIKLRIDELTLQGLPEPDRRRLARAVERELGRLLAAGPFHAPGAVERIDAGRIHLAAGASAESVGTHIARAVHRGLRR